MKMIQDNKEKIRNGKLASNDGVLVEYSYIDNGRKNTVAFINGWGTTTYSEWSKQLGIENYNLLFYNNRGNGNSGLGTGEYMHSCASDLAQLCSNLGVKSLNVVGHSMGGLIETLFFTDYRFGVDVNTITFVSSPDNDPVKSFPYKFLLPHDITGILASYSNGVLGDLVGFVEKRDVVEIAAYLVTRGGGVNMDQKSFSLLYHNFLSRRKADVEALESMRKYGYEIGLSMSRIDVPAMIVHGRRDFFVSIGAAEEIHRRIAGSRLHLFDKSTHAPMIEQPKLFNRLLLDFLDQNNSQPALISMP